VRGTIEEGCIGETIAALEAERARDLAGHPALRAALAHIHEDESAHAELAFKTVAWGLAMAPDLRSMARAAFDRTLARYASDAGLESAVEAAFAPHGILPNSERRAVRRQAISELLQPAIAQALG
jgi:hypothetical protein